jgi:hypothetical protein
MNKLLVTVAIVPFLAIGSLSASQAKRVADRPHDPFEIDDNVLRQRPPCLPKKMTDGAQVVALGAYEGQLTSFSFEGENDAAGTIAVHGESRGPALVLVLSSYDPVIWDFSRFPIHRLRAILAYGYHSQAVASVPKRIPVRFITRQTAPVGCGKPVAVHEGGPKLDQLDGQVRYGIGQGISAFHGGYAPAALHVEGSGIRPGKRSDLRLSEIRGSANLVVMDVPAREPGLVELVRRGAIRQATESDVQAWNAAATQASPTGHLAPVRAERLLAQRSYVVLRATSLPMGMYGGHSRAFIIPTGVPMPTDPGSHNSFYMIASGSCTGPGGHC